MDPVSSPQAPRRSHFVDLSPLKESKPFRYLWLGNSLSGIGNQMTIVAVGLHIYQLTHSTLAVSLVGAFSLIPMILAGLYGGMLADAFDRRVILIISASLAWVATITLATIAWLGVDVVWPFYVLSVVISVAATVTGTVRQAVLPRLLPARLIPAASALSGMSIGVMLTVGPALAGVLVALVGFGWTYTVDVILFLSAFAGILSLPRLAPDGEVQRPGLESLRYGIRFLRGAPNVRMSFIVDIIAMTFGQPRVLFPAAGALVLGGGAVTVGVLTAAGAVGALLSSLFSGRLGGERWHGRMIRLSIVVYGLFIAGFGAVLAVMMLGPFGPVSATHANIVAVAIAAVMLAGSGAADNVSSIFRQTILQTAVPDNVRGRLQGIFTVVVTGGPRIGDIYVGLLATIGAIWFPPLLGGLLIAALLLLITRARKGAFLRYDALSPTP
jgi:MFS family permease